MDASFRYDALPGNICPWYGPCPMDSQRGNISQFITRNGYGYFYSGQLDFELHCLANVSQVYSDQCLPTIKPFLSILEAMGTEGGFCFYASFGILGFILIFLLLPETKGVSLDKMDELLSQGWIRGSKEQELNERLTQETQEDSSEESYE